MKTKLNLLAAGMFLAATSSALASTRYVWQSSPGPAPPYTNWATAAMNIQDAVDAAVAGDEILVTNATYATGGRETNVVAVDKPLALRGVNGPQATCIDGGSTVGCVYLTNGATLSGFTLTNGLADNGGGVYCESTSAVLSNCVLSGNWAGSGGGASGGTLNNCTLVGNSAANGGGAEGCMLNNCTLTGNSVVTYGKLSAYGGGAEGCTLNNCTVTGNTAFGEFTQGVGGGACDSTLNNCTLSGNWASNGGGTEGCTLNNCTVTDNSAGWGGGVESCTLYNCTLTGNSAGWGGGGAESCTLNNCTVTGNSANGFSPGFGGSGGGADACTLNNCIVYFNSDSNGGNYEPGSMLNYCCTTPMPTNGVGNINADPQLASVSHLSAESPCIGAGSATYASGADIDGEAWAHPPSIGCDEYHAGAVTGPLTTSLTATLTNVAVGYPVGLRAFIEGRTDLSVWEFGDGFVQVNEPYTSHTWTAPGAYLVALWAYNDSYPGGVNATLTICVDEGVHYVAASNRNPVASYTSWATAATNIQDALDVAGVGGTVFVTNGTYAAGGRTTPLPGDGATNRVAVDKPLTVRSVNGPGVTVIQGQMPGVTNGYMRCVYLTNGATLAGFTLTNGVAGTGGGVYCESTSAVLSNCVLSGNIGSGSFVSSGGGAAGGTLNNCTLTGNSANSGGGAAGSTLNNCTLSGNSATEGGGGTLIISGEGGGAYNCTLNDCSLTGNSANSGGGTFDSTLNNCTLTGNTANGFFDWDHYYHGGDGGGACGGTLNNCTLTGNSASDRGGGAAGCGLNNCTLIGNSAVEGGGAYEGTLNNCIVYLNSAGQGANYYQDLFGGVLNYCCTVPMPTNGVGNITNAPLFADYAGGNLRLQSNSPCINSGNNTYAQGPTDLDGNPRIVGGMVDIGAYEYQTPTSIISYAWLQQNGLPVDGSADFTDPDRDGLNNWQEWIAGTNPTNALSVLEMLAPVKTNNPSGLVVTWQSVNTRTYFIQSSTNLAAQSAFSTLQSNIVGQAGRTSYTDTTATNTGPYFYRVGVGN